MNVPFDPGCWRRKIRSSDNSKTKLSLETGNIQSPVQLDIADTLAPLISDPRNPLS
jgi:hypothetical protein